MLRNEIKSVSYEILPESKTVIIIFIITIINRLILKKRILPILATSLDFGLRNNPRDRFGQR